MVTTAHDCEEHLEERLATPGQPYHYVGSGLPNVFLTGVRYFVCKICGKQAADIPALKELLASIGRTLVDKPSALTGCEVRFLRKRLSKTQVEFSNLVGFSPERLCTVETKAETVELSRDKLVRVVYRILSGDSRLKNVVSIEKKFVQWLSSIHGGSNGERIMATWLRHQWKVEAEPIAA